MAQDKPDLKTTAGKLQDLRNRLADTVTPVGSDAVEAIRGDGRLTVRDGLELLFDDGTFVETDALARHRSADPSVKKTRPATDGVITGYGFVDGRRVCVFAQDNTVFDGQLGEVYAEKILKIYDLATKTGVPIVGFYAGSGPRLHEGVVTLAMFAQLYQAVSDASGLVPQIAVATTELSGQHAVLAQMADLVIARTEKAHLSFDSDEQALTQVKALLKHLPLNNRAQAPTTKTEAMSGAVDLNSVIPDDGNYDPAAIIAEILDADLLQLQPAIGTAVITGFGHIAGRSVALIATQPNVALDPESATKAARFIRMADAFNLPIVQIVDSAGMVEESPAAYGAAAQLAYANAEAGVGKLTLITRKAIGSGYSLFGAKGTGTDLVYAWPTAEIAVATAQEAAAALDVDAEEYAAEHLTPYLAAERGLVDAVIEPSATRATINDGLQLLERKVVINRPKKHGNIIL